MKRSLLLLSLLFTAFLFTSSAQEEAWFLTSPTLSPEGDRVAFVYQDNIWVAPTDGGTAKKITSMSGSENNPRFSPDGRWIAFNGGQDGSTNIYIVSSNGGPIRQLTWHSAGDFIDSWSWDSEHIIFTSGRMNSYSAYKVSINGGTPVRLFSNHYWNNAHHVVQDRESGTYYFTESGESFRSANRKRYRGDNSPDILSYNVERDEYREITRWEGKDLWPTIDINGILYYASDEYNGEYNLYRYRRGNRERLTSFESSIGRPQVSANGDKVVFTMDYQLYLFDTRSNTSNKIEISLFDNDPIPVEKVFRTQGNITAYDISPDNKKIAFVSRGVLFVSDIGGNFIRRIETDPMERALEVIWLKDSERLLFTRTWNGWPNLFTIKADGSESEEQLTSFTNSARMLGYNSDRTMAVYYSGTRDLNLVDLEELSVKTIANDEFWFRGSQPVFSPDNRFIAFTAFRNFESDILVCEIETGEVTAITGTYLTENSPFWSPDGRYIYFTTDRTRPSYPRGGTASRLYRVPLQRFPDPLRSQAFDAIFSPEAWPKRDNRVVIDTEDMLFRWQLVHGIGASQSNPYVIQRDTLKTVLFRSTHEGRAGLYKLTISPFESNRLEEIRGVTGGRIVSAGRDHYILSGGNIFKLNLNQNTSQRIDISYTFTKDIRKEFRQMFYEGWTVLAENFYDEDMHGVDWEAMRDRYAQYLPHIKTRAHLRSVMNDMFGELNSSHMGFSSRGSEESVDDNTITVGTGIIFDNNNPYVVDRIVKNSPADNISVDVRAGDRLVAVNGHEVDESVSRDYYFTFPVMQQELMLVFERDGEREETRLRPVSSGAINTLLYDEWIAGNQSEVDRQSDKRIAYVHMKNMGAGSLNNFLIEMTSEAVERDALILDLRYNTGGNVHDDVINFLTRKPYLEWRFRDGQMSPQPHFAPAAKPMVILINEQSLSDAEMTTAGLKELGIGTIVGTETYRWIIFTSSKSFVDGSSSRLPAWGTYTLDGENLEWTGVAPDIYIRTDFHDKVSGRDPQLSKAIEILLEELSEAENR